MPHPFYTQRRDAEENEIVPNTNANTFSLSIDTNLLFTSNIRRNVFYMYRVQG